MSSLALLALAAALAPAPAADTTYNGVTLPATVQVGGQSLVLNGVALRKKAVFKVYVAGLYLPARSGSASQILAADQPRHLVMQFLRDVEKDKMCEAWDEALKNNTPDASTELKQQFTTLCEWMEDIKKGEQFAFTYEPGKGTTVMVRGAAKGTLPGKAFADALWKAWIGPKPGPGEGFKRGLLGVQA
ncbi:MAG TPA: chalcone isomerase family protein [Gemmatimonadales bacterium]|nr:chalcone isomerase family protein [Gemmatimonadales bacterium]